MVDDHWRYTSRKMGLETSRQQSFPDSSPNMADALEAVEAYVNGLYEVQRTLSDIGIASAVKAQLAPGQNVKVYVSRYESDNSVREVHVYSEDRPVISASGRNEEHFQVQNPSDHCAISPPETVRFNIPLEDKTVSVNLNDTPATPVRSETRPLNLPEVLKQIVEPPPRKEASERAWEAAERERERQREAEEAATKTNDVPVPKP